MQKKKQDLPVISGRVPVPLKKDFAKMCKEEGYTEAKLVASFARRMVKEWKSKRGNS